MSYKQSRKKPAIPQEMLLTLIIIVAAAIYSFNLRAPLIGTLSDGRHQWLTASTLKFNENWQEDGFFNDYGLMLDYPKSIERQRIIDRAPYLSYLPGAPYEIYGLKQLFPDTPFLRLIHLCNIGNQFAIAFVLALMVLSGAPAHALTYRYIFAAMAAVTYILHPGPMYWHSMVFFSDQAVILPYVLILWCELRLRKAAYGERKKWFWLQSALIALGTFIDWFTLTLAGVLWLLRLIAPLTPSRSAAYAIRHLFQLPGSALPCLAFWYWQVASLQALPAIVQNFQLRAGLTGGFHPLERFKTLFIDQFVYGYMASADVIALGVALIYCLYQFIAYRRQPGAAVSLAALLACLLHTYIFAQHAEKHEFSILKFYAPLAFIAYGLMPAWWMQELANTRYFRTRRTAFENLAFALALLLVGAWGALNLPGYRNWRKGFPTPPHVWHQEMEAWLRKNTTADTVIFSKDITIAPTPPLMMSLSRRSVYTPADVATLDKFMDTLPGSAIFLGIIPAEDAAKCGAGRASASKVRSERRDWLIVKLTAASPQSLKACLTRSGL